MTYNPHGPDWHKVADIPPDITLAEYAAAWIDMAPHTEDLFVYAANARTIVEFGLRGGVSTWALLKGLTNDGRLIGVDIDPNPPLPPAVLRDERFTFVVGDSLTADLPDHTDLVMIDSSHEFTQTVLELVRAAGMKPDRILLHDYLYPETPGVRLAVDGYVALPYLPENLTPYRLETVHPSKWGLAVLVRR